MTFDLRPSTFDVRPGATPSFLSAITTAWRAPVRVPPAEWCSQNIWLPKLASAVQGRWSIDLFPYLRGPIDAFADDSIGEIKLMFATQVGKTALLVALVGYVAANDPGPAMFAGPDEATARRLSQGRIYPVFADSPALAHLLPAEHKWVTLMMDARDMVVHHAWSGSPTKLGDVSIRYLFRMEIDKWSRDDTGEADSFALAGERTKAFPNAKKVDESTPTRKGTSRIEREYEGSDRRTYHVPCPHCGRYQELVFEQLKWAHGEDGHSVSPAEARRWAWYECKHCKGKVTDRHKPTMLRKGVWVRDGERVTKTGKITGTPKNPGRIAGFTISSIYSPVTSFGECAEAWLRAWGTRDPGQIQNFVNGWLGRTYEAPARETRQSQVLACRGIDQGIDYPPHTCPMEPRAIIITADVHDDNLHYVVRAWCAGARSFLLRYGVVEHFVGLQIEALQRTYRYGTAGEECKAAHVFIDSGHRTEEVYQACIRYRWNPIKGHDSDRMSSIHPKMQPNGLLLYNVCSPVFREHLLNKILNVPLDGPGSWMVHNKTGMDYADQVTARRCVLNKTRGGQLKRQWVNTRADDHLMDCEVYQLAASSILQLDLEAAVEEAEAAVPRRKRGGEIDLLNEDLSNLTGDL